MPPATVSRENIFKYLKFLFKSLSNENLNNKKNLHLITTSNEKFILHILFE